mmetsp:Transcript_44150/g.134447  ORF Transcript_44150/g.134447 Transcript_44150/m.134447 type:complete len:277 (-) Transcript_44150:996-1826(-)
MHRVATLQAGGRTAERHGMHKVLPLSRRLPGKAQQRSHPRRTAEPRAAVLLRPRAAPSAVPAAVVHVHGGTKDVHDPDEGRSIPPLARPAQFHHILYSHGPVRMRPIPIDTRPRSTLHDHLRVLRLAESHKGLLECQYLPEEYPERIRIDRQVVRTRPRDFRGHVPPRTRISRESIGSVGVPTASLELLRQPEIEQLEYAAGIESDVLGLDVPVGHVPIVEVSHGAGEVEHDAEALEEEGPALRSPKVAVRRAVEEARVPSLPLLPGLYPIVERAV